MNTSRFLDSALHGIKIKDWDGLTQLPPLDFVPDIIYITNSRVIRLPVDYLHKNVQRTYISCAQIENPDFSFFENLRYISIRDIASEPLTFSSNCPLEIVKYQGYDLLKHIPSWLDKVETLRDLTLQIYDLEEIPPYCFNPQLTLLSIADSKLKAFPPEIGRLTKLEELWVRNSEPGDHTVDGKIIDRYYPIDQFPPEIGNLVSLRKFDLASYGGRTFPREFGNLRSLERFTCKAIGLDWLPGEFGNLKNIQELDLEAEDLQIIEDGFGGMSRLKVLRIVSRFLQALPADFGNLKSLKEATISGQLTELPSGIGHLKNVTKLDLSFNSLRRIPREIIGCEKLSLLDLSYNPLEYLPPELAKMPKLKRVSVKDHQLQWPPAIVAKKGWPKMKEWMLEHADEYPFAE